MVREVAVPAPGEFVRDERKLALLEIPPRELEILTLIAEGLSNKEIAERAYYREQFVDDTCQAA